MVYLFNSGYRLGYQVNLLNTLFYPSGWINEYRYTYSDTEHYFDGTQLDTYLKLKNEKAVIIAVDRFYVAGYSYHPVREGILKGCYQDGNRLLFMVELGNYIYPKDNNNFTNELINNFPFRPKLTNGNPESTNDGFYAFAGKDIIGDSGKFIYGVEAWEKVTDQLASTHTYVAKQGDETVFARIEMDVSPAIQNSGTADQPIYKSYYKLVKGTTYTIDFSFKYPGQKGNATVETILKGKDSLRFDSNDRIELTTRSDYRIIKFTPKRYTDEKTENLGFVFSRITTSLPFNFNSPRINMDLKLEDGSYFWLQVVLTTLLWVICTLLVGLDYSKLKQQNLQQIIFAITYWKIAAAFLNAAILIWIFRLWGGKKPY
ncbi:hypothetical protein FHW88_002505 [Mucilaginibacter sp. SG538B]|uniref:hypothetical protein n=1 Tax=Mucilaginibacter sp. SG538B TaxID=2587021 RepID=UPI00159D955D|nr:hypothetical protein [Mucilaginibacter sp. SG538B]NVM64177.1 hypothetical protein [Mucilaginibacter sp. SG538B]NVM64216.1 hypothetical protein [Mucilaginibacter sp. SG538B]